MNEHELRLLEVINTVRVGRGLAALRLDDRLAMAAYEHTVDLSRHPGMLHVGSDGSDIDDRMRRAGYEPNHWREVVGWGWGGDVARMVDWWLNSADHAPILLDNMAVDVGAGYVYAPGTPWGHYWTVDFAAGDGVVKPPVVARPYSSYAPVVLGGTVAPAPVGLDMLDYMRGDGRAYRVGNQRGTFEVFQTQTDGDRFYQVKSWDDLSVVHWEEFVVASGYIGRDVDTSPGGGRFYRQFGAPWVKRRMRVGESFSQAKRVQFYRADDCEAIEQHSGNVVDTITLVEHLSEWRSVFGVELKDVIRLRWEQGGEDYWWARGYGLVAWRRAHNDENSPVWSAISEMRPDVGRLTRLRLDCLE